jgi:peptidoglycan/xylan/chitin deacetylase (PgdA/CDA1 family)
MRKFPKVYSFHAILPDNVKFNPRLIGALKQSEFERTIRFIKTFHNVLHPNEFKKKLLEGVRFGIRDALITMDDGFDNQYEFALPILEKLNVPAVIFVSSLHIENKCWLWFCRYRFGHINGLFNNQEPKYIDNNILEIENKLAQYSILSKYQGEFEFAFNGISEKHLKKLANHPLIEIGGHTHTHPQLHNENLSKIKLEILSNKDILENLTNKSVVLFAYPEGYASEEVLTELVSAGFLAAFALDWNFDKISNTNFFIPRVGIYRYGIIYTMAKMILNRIKYNNK